MGGVAIVHHLLVANLLLPCTGEQVGRHNGPKGSSGCGGCEHRNHHSLYELAPQDQGQR
jgi:hypothetical protein